MKTFVSDSVSSDGDKRRLLELRRQAQKIVSTVTDRLEVTITSLDASHRRFEEARINAIAAMHLYHEALLALAEDDDDDFADALQKRDKFDLIETEYLDSGELYTAALNRLGWELRNSGAESA